MKGDNESGRNRKESTGKEVEVFGDGYDDTHLHMTRKRTHTQME